MGSARFVLTSKTQFHLLNRSVLKEFVFTNMHRKITSFLVLVYSHVVFLFGSLYKYLFRNLDNHEANCGSKSNVRCDQKEEEKIGSSLSEDSEIDHKSNGEAEDSVVMETLESQTSSKYEFLSEKDISGFFQEPETFSFTIHEALPDSNDDSIKKMSPPILQLEQAGSVVDETERSGDSVIAEGIEFVAVSTDTETDSVKDDGSQTDIDRDKPLINIVLEDEGPFLASESNALHLDGNVTEHADDSVESSIIQQETSEKEECETPTINNFNDVIAKKTCEEEQISYCRGENQSIFLHELVAEKIGTYGFVPNSPVLEVNFQADDTKESRVVFTGSEWTESDDEYIELEPSRQDFSVSSDEEIWSEEEKYRQQDSVHEEPETTRTHSSSKEHNSPENNSFQDNCTEIDDDEDDYESEHDELIEQLRMELKQARTGGLPTILEESESNGMIMKELNPLKIDQKQFEYKDCMNEIQKVYKCYVDKMRKLDILNLQAMHSLGLIQQKEARTWQTARKFLAPALKSILSNNLLWPCKQVRDVVDPTKKAIQDIQLIFELVYVGQLCLSWEILHWQCRKAQEMLEFDSQESPHRYNQVADEFQRFQVLIQRFFENEPFQGSSRVQNYVKNRCIARDLLQIPVIKEDGFNERKRGCETDAITCKLLIRIIEETMQVLWEFLHADDKDERNYEMASRTLHDQVDLDLLTDIRTNLRKKEKQLKHIMRSRNCMVKKLKPKNRENGKLSHSLLVAQVELKLVSIVLNMLKLTKDQLVWCHEKLDRINFCNNRVSIEPSFFIFPC